MKWIAHLTKFNFWKLKNHFELKDQKCDGPLKKKTSEHILQS